MTENNRSPRKRLWIVLLIVLAVLILLTGTWWLQSVRLERARLGNMPPFVFLSHPQQGDRFQAGQMVFVDASSRGSRPIMLLELLVDGQVIAEDLGPNPEGSIVRYGHFSFRVEEGMHIIHVRATDSAGAVGLSVPLGIQALAPTDERNTVLLRFGPEVNLEGIAEMAGISPDELIEFNPSLGEGVPPGGGFAVVPTMPDDDQQEPDEEQPTPPPGSIVHGGTTPSIVGNLFPNGNASNLPWALAIPASLPSAPVDIAASLQNCQVTVSWSVLAQDASLYRLWIDAQDGSRQLVGTFKPSNPPAERYTTTFDPPRAGRLALYVEAVNAIGAQSSRTAMVDVNRECAEEGEDRLQFETVSVEVDPGIHQVYFYLSFDGSPEFRLPRDDSQFFKALGGQAVISGTSGADNLLSLPSPQNGILNLAGECWGWAGGEPQRLSVFQQQISQSAWVGSPVVVGDANCQITLKLQGIPGFMAVTTYAGDAGGLPAPYDLDYKSLVPSNAQGFMSSFARTLRDVSWKWDGNPQDITGFTIYLNGQPVLKVQGADQRKARIILPLDCGPPPTFYVVANGVQGDSPPSSTTTIWQSPCTHYARIEFFYLNVKWTCDGICTGYKSAYCRRLEAYYRFSVNGLTRRYFSSNFPRYMWCGNYPIEDLMPAQDAVFLVPISIDPVLHPFEVVVDTEFWDQDDWSGDDSFGHHQKKFGFNNWNHAVGFFNSECGNIYDGGQIWYACPPSYDDQFLYTYDVAISGTAHTTLKFYFSVYPNAVKDNP